MCLVVAALFTLCILPDSSITLVPVTPADAKQIWSARESRPALVLSGSHMCACLSRGGACLDNAKLAMRIISHVKEDNWAEVLRRLSRRGKKKPTTKKPSCIVVSTMFFQCFRCVCATVSAHKLQLTVIVGKRSSCKHLQGSRSGSVDEALGVEEQVGPSGWSCLHGWRSWRGRKSSCGGVRILCRAQPRSPRLPERLLRPALQRRSTNPPFAFIQLRP